MIKTDETVHDYRSLLHKLANTIVDIEHNVGSRFPLYRIADDQLLSSPRCDWVTSSRGSWLAGFWVGSCWLAGYATDSESLITCAQQRWQQLKLGFENDSLFRAMNAWYGLGPAVRLQGDEQADELLQYCQRQLEATYARWGGFPLGSTMGGGIAGKNRLCIDPCAALVALGSHAGWQDLPLNHTHLIAHQLINEFGDVYTYSDYQPASESSSQDQWFAVGEAGHWPRGQSWGALAMVSAAEFYPSDFLSLAERCCQRWWQRYADQLPVMPPNDGSVVDQYDPSATLINAVSFFKLDQALGGNTEWWDRGLLLLHSVIDSRYFKDEDDRIYFMGCCYRISASQTDNTEMAYGYFFLLQALMVASGTVKANHF
ncbi:hypothetical protein [Photobacterium nomapromontoriensis]|uniref:hypothetical protein n=1 Tax=Photobacterium nomapromontoriensis TaxID=2910237 RepID=UPI003D13AAEC